MAREVQERGERRQAWLKQYVVGLGLGPALMLYGVSLLARLDDLGWYAAVVGVFLCGRFYLWQFAWFREYVVGLALGAATAIYGVVALWSRHTFLPGLKGGNSGVSGTHGAGLAAAYIAGGLFLICRLFLHRRCRSESSRGQVYLVQNLLLIVLILSLAYVLWQVGTVR